MSMCSAVRRFCARKAAMGAQKIFHRLPVRLRHQGFGLRQHARPRRALGQRGRRGQRATQEVALAFRVTSIPGGTEARDARAVGLD
jgi:hypothetical protein